MRAVVFGWWVVGVLGVIGFACGRSVTYGNLVVVPDGGPHLDASVPIVQALPDAGCIPERPSYSHGGALIPTFDVSTSGAPGIKVTVAFDWNTLVFEGVANQAGTLTVAFDCVLLTLPTVAGDGPKQIVDRIAANLPAGYVERRTDLSGGDTSDGAWSIEVNHAP